MILKRTNVSLPNQDADKKDTKTDTDDAGTQDDTEKKDDTDKKDSEADTSKIGGNIKPFKRMHKV